VRVDSFLHHQNKHIFWNESMFW